jgi:ligand-binding SRPBCC domain-containing protein
MHIFEAQQELSIDINTAWTFFSRPENLKILTPPSMGIDITSTGHDRDVYPGMMIAYTLKAVAGIPLEWVTEITHVRAPYFFVDEQRIGPYALWHHEHELKEIPGGVAMTDRVAYRLPLGPLGALVNTVFVRRRLEQIFAFRRSKLEQLFPPRGADD